MYLSMSWSNFAEILCRMRRISSTTLESLVIEKAKETQSKWLGAFRQILSHLQSLGGDLTRPLGLLVSPASLRLYTVPSTLASGGSNACGGELLRWFWLAPQNRRPDSVSPRTETECRLGRHPDTRDTTSVRVVTISCWLPCQAG